MKITSLNLEADSMNGLQGVKMTRLSSVVLIAGKNGAGKSRLLSSVQAHMKLKPNHSALIKSESRIGSLKHAISDTGRKLQIQKRDPLKNKENIAAHENNISTWEAEFANIKNRIEWALIETDNISENYGDCCLNFVPKQLDLFDCNNYNKTQLYDSSKSVDSLGVGALSRGVLAKIQTIQNRWFETSNSNSSATVVESNEARDNYDNLSKTIYDFLNTKLDRNPDGDATLFGMRLGDSKLSDGQKVLLQLCVAIYSQSEKINELILFLDEPENHLHPAALIEVVDTLSNVLTDGQLWIATHSIHLLSHFDSSSIWYMEDGGISHSGSQPEKVLEGLVGDDERIGKLSQFLTLPAELAQARFALQSLLPPKTIDFGKDDPQTNQVLEILNNVCETGNPIKLLDFGAGKARLLSAAESYSIETGVPVASWLDYYALDLPDSSDEQVARDVINGVYGEGLERYFNDEQSLLVALEKDSFDFVLMCNVFHELDPNNWKILFDEQSVVRQLLNGSGKLLVVEDQLIPVGEQAYKNGFLVFDELQFQTLFKIERYHCNDARDDGRLKAHLLPSSCLGNLDDDSRKDSIKNLHHHAKQKITSLRGDEPSYKNGRLHGFWVQQYANAGLCLA